MRKHNAACQRRRQRSSVSPPNQAFYYYGLNHYGQRINGRLRAPNHSAAKAQLKQYGIVNAHVRRRLSLPFSQYRDSALNRHDVLCLTRELLMLLRAGMPLLRALILLEQGHLHTRCQSVLSGLKNHVENGCSFAHALRQYPDSFDRLYCGLVAAGEQSGQLHPVLQRLLKQRTATQRRRTAIHNALIYPSAVLLSSLAISGILLYVVAPRFARLFAQYHTALPALTQHVMTLSQVVKRDGWLGVLLLIGLLYGLRHLYRYHRWWQERFERWQLYCPLWRSLLKKTLTAHCCDTLATLLKAGLSLTQALQHTIEATPNVVYRTALQNMHTNIRHGQSLPYALAQTQLFSQPIVHLVAIGSESGRLSDILQHIAHDQEARLKAQIEALISLLEPCMILILGGLVGGLVVALYLPLFHLGALF